MVGVAMVLPIKCSIVRQRNMIVIKNRRAVNNERQRPREDNGAKYATHEL
jgi:hypothetical protein